MFMTCKMAGRIFLLCLLVSLLSVSYIECRFGFRGSWGSPSRSSWSRPSISSHSYPSSSSGLSGWRSVSYNKPSSSLGSSWSSGSSSSSHSYPSSSSGLSGSGSSSYNKPSSSSGSSWNFGSASYPSSSSGLSGTGFSSYNKPSSSSGSSWNFGSASYPSSSSGLSGTGSSSYNKPSSSSGSSWNFGSASYPSSSSGLSGSGSSSYNKPSFGSSWSSGSSSSGSRSHSYPSSTGLSGSQSNSYKNNYNRPTCTYNSNSGHYYGVPSYYTAPQYVYIHEYRNSNSRYGDLLTGLSLYNLGRSQSHYHDHYYYDDYYRNRYDNPKSTSYRQENKPQDSANCVLKVKENGREEVLKIPCEIVSTFTEGSKKVAPSQQTQMNKTVCTSAIKTINNRSSSVPAVSVGLPASPAESLNSSLINSTITETLNQTGPVNGFDSKALWSVFSNLNDSSLDAINAAFWRAMSVNGTGTSINSTTSNNYSNAKLLSTLAANTNMWPLNSNVSTVTTTLPVNDSSVSVTTTVTAVNATTVNVTVCTTNFTFVDPLTVQGSPVDPKNIECVVEIQTRDAFFSNVIDCNTLVAYAKLPEPKKSTGILPPREKLKSWLAKPPWWMSLFIAV